MEIILIFIQTQNTVPAVGRRHQKEAECFTSDELETLWELFGEIPINDNDEIEDCFLDFPVGTDRFEIWLWFDELYPEGVAKLTGTI